jgi:hypothetical protein
MGAVEGLTALMRADDRFAIPHAELREAQIEALNERFQERRERIKLLTHRAKEANLGEIRAIEDVVPLLFPHTAYKSYPEAWLSEQKWDRMGKWLGTISSYPITPIDTSDIRDIDDWLARLEAVGHFVSCSSGTTGKSAMLIASAADLEWSCIDNVAAFSWGSGVEPRQDRRMFGLAPVAHVPKNIAIGDAQTAAFGDPRCERFRLPVPPITVGQLTRMVLLRKAIADGTARPADIAALEATSKERQEILDKALVVAAEALIAARKEKLFVSGLWNALHQIAQVVRGMGYSGVDFHPDNCIYVGGGLKRALLPPDYQQFVHETFNIPAHRTFQIYSMQELGSTMPRCREGRRYHVPPWIVPMILNRDGDALIPQGEGEVEGEGRAAFFDLSLDGRWGGVITGDRISLDLGASACACGSASPTIRDDIVRYADLEGDDKIGCAGTVDAYVRGVS